MSSTHEPTPKEQFLTNLSNFLQRYRLLFIIILVVVVAGILTFAIVSEVIKNRTAESTYQIEQVQQDYREWVASDEEQTKQELQESILADCDRIIKKYSKLYAAQRALFIKGSLFFKQEQWDRSIDNFTTLANTFPESYLAPIALVNSSVALEESGKVEEAIELYNTILDSYRESFPGIPQVLFSLGRLNEKIEDFEAAQAAYEELEDNFSSSNWTKLARNRIIKLTVDGKI
jgi:TolA-binding protein